MDTDTTFPITPCSTPSSNSNPKSNPNPNASTVSISNSTTPKAKNRDPTLDQLKQIRQIIEPIAAAIPILKRELAALSTQFNIFSKAMETTLNPARCIFCDDGHDSTKCEQYSTSASKMQRTVELGKCIRCLETAERDHGCEEHCGECQQAHHTLLCWKQDLRPKENRQPQQTQGKEGGPKLGGYGPLKTRYRRSGPTPSRPYFHKK